MLKMTAFTDVCSFTYLFFNWDLVQELNRLLKDTNRAEQSENLPLSDRTAAGLRLNLHSQPDKQSQIGVCLRSLYLPVRMFEPGGVAVLLLRKQQQLKKKNLTSTDARFSYSNRSPKSTPLVELGSVCVFREGGVEAAHGARQEALSSASVLAGAVARGW